jgi:hypothetical protein
MKTLAVLAATLAISLTCAGTASAQRSDGGSVIETRTSTDAFGNQRSVTRRRNSDGSASVSVTRTGTDAFGNRRSVTRRITDNGSVRCQTVTSRASDAFGDSASRTVRRCAADF